MFKIWISSCVLLSRDGRVGLRKWSIKEEIFSVGPLMPLTIGRVEFYGFFSRSRFFGFWCLLGERDRLGWCHRYIPQCVGFQLMF